MREKKKSEQVEKIIRFKKWIAAQSATARNDGFKVGLQCLWGFKKADFRFRHCEDER